MYLYPYNMNSEGSANLAKALGVKRIRTENSNFVGRADKVVINWGASQLPPEVNRCRVINPSEATRVATDKLEFFKKISGHARVVPWTANAEEAYKWYNDGKVVVGRSILRGSGGAGLYILDKTEENWPTKNLPLYTLYVQKKDEYRVHFVNGQIIDFQRKALRPEYNPEDTNWKVRNLDNGFIFVRSDVTLPEDVIIQCEATIAAIGLDFGAIDVIYNQKREYAYVLEVNTAPGLMGTTLENYAKAFEIYRSK